MANLDDSVKSLSSKWGISLVPREIETQIHEDGTVYSAKLFANGAYYGFLVVMTNLQGNLNFCAYLGSHPKSQRSKPINLAAETQHGEVRRLDKESNLEFLP